MSSGKPAAPRSNLLRFPAAGERTPRSLRLVKPLPPAPDTPEKSDTFETIPGSRRSDSSPDETIVDPDLGMLVRETLSESGPSAIPAAPETELMLDRPLPAPSAPTLPPLVPSPESTGSLEDMTEVMFDADAAIFPIKRAPVVRGHVVDSDIAYERPSRGPALVAHVIPPRRNYALVAALLAWTLAVAFGVYVITTHRAMPAAPAQSPASTTVPPTK